MKTLETILSDFQLATGLLSSMGGMINPALPPVATLLDNLLKSINAAIAAHEAVNGQPLDLTKLQPIKPVQ